MSARRRVVVAVVAAALAAAAGVVGVTKLTSRGDVRAAPASGRDRLPPLLLDFGVRGDREAGDLRRALELYGAGRPQEAASIFTRYRSLEARIGADFAAWPGPTLGDLEALALDHPRSSLVQLHLGIARRWAGREDDALLALTAATRAEPDTPYAVDADTLLHPNLPPGVPTFVPARGAPATIARLEPAAQLRALRRGARRADAHARILLGVALQGLGRQRSAEREYVSAARLAPDDAEAQVAAALGRFDKDRPARAFSRLGPLVRRFPRAATVRFHLGLALFWIGRIQAGEDELRLARTLEPRSPIGREAARYLQTIQRERGPRAEPK